MNVIGRTIVDIRYLSDEEAEETFWMTNVPATTVLVLDDGSEIVPLSDEEGNSGGVMIVTSPDDSQKSWYVWPDND